MLTVAVLWFGPKFAEVVLAGGEPVANGALVARQGGKDVFHVDLEEGKGDIALTPSDGPYTFVLRKGARESSVATRTDPPRTAPLVLESEELGMTVAPTVGNRRTGRQPR